MITVLQAEQAPAATRQGAPGGLVLTTALAPAAWGTTYLVTTELLPPDRPLLAGVLRALPAGLVLAAITRRRPVGAWWGKALVLGTLNIGGFFALLFVAAYRLPGGVAATLGAVQPLIAAGLGAVLLRERIRSHVVIAGVLGVIGVALLVLRAGAQLDATGVIAGFAGATSMASGVVLTKRWGRPVPLLAFTTWQLVAGGLVLLPVALAVEGAPPHLTGTNLLGYLWLGTAGTGVAYSLWFRGIDRLPVGRVSLLGLLSPIVATLAGWLVLDQRLTVLQVAGAALVLTVARPTVRCRECSGGFPLDIQTRVSPYAAGHDAHVVMHLRPPVAGRRRPRLPDLTTVGGEAREGFRSVGDRKGVTRISRHVGKLGEAREARPYDR